MASNMSSQELEKRRIERAIDTLEYALGRCRSEDMRTPQVYAALKLLEQHVKQKWPLDQFCEALHNTGSEDWQDGRWQTLSASLDEIKSAVGAERTRSFYHGRVF